MLAFIEFVSGIKVVKFLYFTAEKQYKEETSNSELVFFFSY